MDPLSLGLGVIGLGMSVFSGFSSSSTAKQEAQVSADMSYQEQQQDNLRKQQMELSSQRGQLENLRNMQRARAMGIQAGVNQGAQFGSGLAGGLAAVQSQGLMANRDAAQNLAIGEGMFNYTSKINQDKQQLAQLQGQQAENAGWASLGGALMKSSPVLGQLGSFGMNSFKSANLGNLFMGGGSPSGYGA